MRSQPAGNGKIIHGFEENGFKLQRANHAISRMINRQTFLNWILKTLRESAWAPLSLYVIYRVAKAFGAYLAYPPLDVPTHFLGGVAIAYFFRSAIANSQKLVGNIPVPIQILFALTCTGTTTILWEFLEFVSDYFFHTNMILGLKDTLKDMFFGLLGGLILLLLIPNSQPASIETNSD